MTPALTPEYGADRLGYLPSNSPDFNPIENVWHVMKDFIRTQHPTNRAELRTAIEDAYEAITPQILRNLFDSMPARMQAAIDKGGERTPRLSQTEIFSAADTPQHKRGRLSQ